MALTNNDFYYLNNSIAQMKHTMMNLASEYGPNHSSTFMMSYADIKNHAQRQRLTETTLNEYMNMLSGHGFHVDYNDNAILVTVAISSMILAPNDAVNLSNSLSIFRSRAAINGDIENL